MWKIQQLPLLYLAEPGGTGKLRCFEWHKGLKYNTFLWVHRSPRLPFAFLSPSQHLCLILLYFQFPLLLSFTLLWSLCLFSLSAVPDFHLPLTNQLHLLLQARSFLLSSHLRIYLLSCLVFMTLCEATV